jgi:hypothetical protein
MDRRRKRVGKGGEQGDTKKDTAFEEKRSFATFMHHSQGAFRKRFTTLRKSVKRPFLGFQDRRDRPLCHPSGGPDDGGILRRIVASARQKPEMKAAGAMKTHPQK